MAALVDVLIAFSWFANIILDIGAAYYCYRMIKITGGFRAWWLIIGFTILFAISSFSSVSYSVLSSDLTASASESGTAAFNVVLGLIMSILLFAAMFGLNKTFKKVQATQAG